MPSRYRRLLLLVLSLLMGLRTAPGRAQSLDLPDDTDRQQARGAWLPGFGHGFVVQTAIRRGAVPAGRFGTGVRLLLIDSTVGRRPTDSVWLAGPCTPLFAAAGKQHVLYRFRRLKTDTMISVVADARGRILTVKRQLHGTDKTWDYLTLPHPRDGFVLANEGARNRHLWVRYLRPDLTEAWVWNVPATEGRVQLDAYAADAERLWLVVTDDAADRRKATSSAICLDLLTGRELTRIPLDQAGKTHRFVTACAPDGTGGLLVAGQAFDERRPRPDHDGELYVQRLQPDGSRQPETRLTLGRRLPHHLHWQHVQPLPDGGVRLIGETYTSTSRLTHHALAISTALLTVGRFTLSFTTLRPRGLVLADLTPAGAMGQLRTLDLPDGGKFTAGGYWPARTLAVAATQAGAMQWRGPTPDSLALLIRSAHRIQRVSLADWSTQTLATTGRKNSLDVWGFPRPDGPPLLLEYVRRPRATRVFYPR